MNVLDENVVAHQTKKLKVWSIPFRQVGRDIAVSGASDENLLPVLHRLPQPTFFTHDEDFFDKSLCHLHYAIVYIDVTDTMTAEIIRRFLKHPSFNTQAKRLGMVARAHTAGVQFWRRRMAGLPEYVAWPG